MAEIESEFNPQQIKTAKVFVSLIVIEVMISIIGVFIILVEIAQIDGMIEAVIALPGLTKLFLIGVFVFFIMMSLFSLILLYRTGKYRILKWLYQQIKYQLKENYPILKWVIILFISCFAAVAVSIIVLMLLILYSPSSSFIGAIDDIQHFILDNHIIGAYIIGIGVFLLIITGLALFFRMVINKGFIYLYEKIIEANKKTEFRQILASRPKKIVYIGYGIFLGILLLTSMSIIYAFLDLTHPPSLAVMFPLYHPIHQLIIVFGTIIAELAILILLLSFYRKMFNFNVRFLYSHLREYKDKSGDQIIKFIAIGVSISLFIMGGSLIFMVLSLIVGGSLDLNFEELSEIITGLEIGVQLLILAFILIISYFMALCLIFFTNNGFFLIKSKMIYAEEKMDKKFEVSMEQLKNKPVEAKAKVDKIETKKLAEEKKPIDINKPVEAKEMKVIPEPKKLAEEKKPIEINKPVEAKVKVDKIETKKLSEEKKPIEMNKPLEAKVKEDISEQKKLEEDKIPKEVRHVRFKQTTPSKPE
jgi:hypothetical protein